MFKFCPSKFAIGIWQSAILLVLCAAVSSAIAQSPAKEDAKTDERPAQVLYEDANGYLGRKYQEFNKQKLPYDPTLEAKTKKEQHELAVRNAVTLQARQNLQADDLYYLGMLHHLAGDGDAALDTMRRLLKINPDGQNSQTARNVIVLYAIKKNLIPEAEATVVAYSEHQPQNPEDRYKMELIIADAFYRGKDYTPMVAHAFQMMEAARLFAATHKTEVFRRDEMLIKSAVFLSEAYVKSNQKETAIKVLEDLRRMSLALPSGNLYKLASARLASLDPQRDLHLLFSEKPGSTVEAPPEVIGKQWIDQEPKTLADLRGQVVLLDFWAHWCGPCLYTFPKLERWHEVYKNKGLVILGITNYQGQAEGRKMTPGEELVYLRDFKKRNRLSYGFLISDTDINNFNYGVFSIPMSFLIDRKGNIRFIAAGANDDEITEMGRMIRKLVEEAPDSKASETVTKADAPGKQ